MLRPALLACLLTAPLAAQSPVSQAETAFAAGQAWRASQLLAPVVAAPSGRTPETLLLAARAAAQWNGWATVRRLLDGAPWLDARFDRLGRRLLAEASLGEFRHEAALLHARAAVGGEASARDPAEQGRRLLLLARALDRADSLDAAAAAYRAAMPLLPAIADWLALRAAGIGDSAALGGTVQGISLPVARARIGPTIALAHDRRRDHAGAAERWLQLGDRPRALQSRWRGAASDGARTAPLPDLLALLRPDASTADARAAIDLLPRLDPVPALDRDARLLVARRAAALGRSALAVEAFATAAEGGALEPGDRFAYAGALAQLRRWPEAAAQYTGITEPAFAGRAAYYAAQTTLRAGNAREAVPALLEVARRFPDDTVAAGTALYLLGDLMLDDGRPDSARALFRTLDRRYPSSTYRPRALILSALIALENGDAARSAEELSAALARRPPAGLEGDAVRYWLARARLAAGEAPAARAMLRDLVARGPENYYAVRAAERLDTTPWRMSATRPAAIAPAHAAAFARIALLDSLGMDTEAGFEVAQLTAAAIGAAPLAELAEAFAAAGRPNRAMQLAQRALTAGAPRDGALWRLLYPLPWETPLREAATLEGVDPLLAAALIRQESNFEPRAVSGADARGLMQITPATGRGLARAFGFLDFDVALLHVPEVNLSFGMRHVAAALGRYPDVERALAAYNAGASPVNRWSLTLLGGRRPGSAAEPLDDVEAFVERIPYEETRGYVRAVLRNRAVYRMMYQK